MTKQSPERPHAKSETPATLRKPVARKSQKKASTVSAAQEAADAKYHATRRLKDARIAELVSNGHPNAMAASIWMKLAVERLDVAAKLFAAGDWFNGVENVFAARGSLNQVDELVSPYRLNTPAAISRRRAHVDYFLFGLKESHASEMKEAKAHLAKAIGKQQKQKKATAKQLMRKMAVA